MGCYPFGRIVSKVFGRRDGKYNRTATRRMSETRPRTRTYDDRALTKTVTFSTNNHVFKIPPTEVSQSSPEQMNKQHHETLISPAPLVCETIPGEAPTHPPPTADVHEARQEPKQVRFGDESSKQKKKSSNKKKRNQPEPEPSSSGPGRYYVPSPLPEWEVNGEHRRRRDCFGGEFYYYPTPIREGIYSIATDANRLTSMFSEENPNACTIV